MASLALVIVNYRNPEDTLACLESLERADHGPLKIFLIDNASGDDSPQRLRAFLASSPLRADFEVMGGNAGYAAGVNAGLRKALAEGIPHLVVLNNDVRVDGGITGELLKACAAHPDEVVAGLILNAATGRPAHNVGRITRITRHIRFLFEPGEAEKGVDFVSGCLMLIPAAVVRRVGLFEERYFMYCEDLEFCLRLKRAGIRIAYFPSIRIWHNVSSSVEKAGLSKEYYFVRNQTYINIHGGNWYNALGNTLYFCILMCYKLKQPKVFAAIFRGLGDGLLGRMGRR